LPRPLRHCGCSYLGSSLQAPRKGVWLSGVKGIIQEGCDACAESDRWVTLAEGEAGEGPGVLVSTQTQVCAAVVSAQECFHALCFFNLTANWGCIWDSAPVHHLTCGVRVISAVGACGCGAVSCSGVALFIMAMPGFPLSWSLRQINYPFSFSPPT
jgi:hypothetical protein